MLATALDLVAFMAIWTGLSGHRSGQAREPVRVKRRVAAKRKPKRADAKARAEALFRHTPNDNTNVVPFNAACRAVADTRAINARSQSRYLRDIRGLAPAGGGLSAFERETIVSSRRPA
jgi:hypothetical protein